MVEMEWHEGGRGKTSVQCDWNKADDAESVKCCMRNAFSAERHAWDIGMPLTSMVWNRVQLQRLRFKGAMHWYVVVRTWDGVHRLLVLHVPPRKFTCSEARQEHALRQATYQDDRQGNYSPGVRVRWDELRPLVEGDDVEWLDTMTTGGVPLQLHTRPAPYHRRGNFKSYEEHRDKGDAELRRMLERGVIEGPLLYRPWVVNPMGGVWQEEKGKWRTIHDLTASGVNDATQASTCQYDMLEDVLQEQTPGCYMIGWDLKDAFFNQGRRQEHCDYMGTETGGEFYRHRSTVFGGTDGPEHQQRTSNLWKRALNKKGQEGGWPDIRNTAAFMDDGHGIAPSSLTLANVQQQFTNMMEFFGDMGFADSEHKRVCPTTLKSYVGILIDSQEQTCRVEPSKVQKYTQAWHTLKEAASKGAVSRLNLASVIGKLQHTAPLVRGGQQLLGAAYTARDAVARGSELSWRQGCEVWLHAEAIKDLDTFVGLLPDAERRYYLDGAVKEENGFFAGFTSCTHEEMDSTSEAHARIPVYTTDASGFAGGGFSGDERFYHEYGVDERAPARSSNYRELDTGWRALEAFAEKKGWNNTRVLWRTDNTVSRAVVNKQGTMADSLGPVSSKIQNFCREKGLDLAACHIRGEENGLADRISRYVWDFDTADWMMVEKVFNEAERCSGRTLTLDGAADPVGSNSHLPRFCSKVESYFRRDLTGEALIANPDYKLIAEYLAYFLRYWRKSPHNTSGVFMLPIWESQGWWRLLKGAMLLFWIREGSSIFTSPEWFAQTEYRRRPANRIYRGETKWDVMVVFYPPTLASRGGSAGKDAQHDQAAAEGGRGRTPLLRMSGDVARDLQALYGLPPLEVHEL